MNISDLHNKPLFLMTGEEFILLQKSTHDENQVIHKSDSDKKKYVYGIRGIATLFDCSIPTAQRIKNSGVLDIALTQIGRKIIVDAELALQLKKIQK